jgi:hypothetical protein
MKLVIPILVFSEVLFTGCSASQIGDPAAPSHRPSGGFFGLSVDAKRLSVLFAGADQVVFKGEMEKSGRTDTDREWIARMNGRIAQLSLDDGDYCLCCGWMTAYFYRKGALLGSLAPIHGNQVRIMSQVGNGDYKIPEDQWKAINAIFREKMKANPLPTPADVTPAASAPVAPPSSAAGR